MLLLLLIVLAVFTPSAVSAQDTFDGVPRIVAVGDVHGAYDEFVSVLRQAGVVDARHRWSGGRTHLVQTGDVVDRGADSRKVLDLLMALEKQAARAGGRVHALIGNHEVMNIVGDLRDVSEGEFAAFRSANAEALRDRAYELLAEPARRDDPAYRRQWEQTHPLGWVEHRQAFGDKGVYGKWIRGHNVAVRINGILFVHGGISPKALDLTIGQINDRVRRELADLSLLEGGLANDADGPLWYRGLATAPEAAIEAHVAQASKVYGVRHFVVGHTVVAPAIVPRLNGSVVTVDVGLSPAYGGPPAALVVDNGRWAALHRGQLIDLPRGGELRAYLEKAASLDPAPSPILKVIDELAPAASTGQTPGLAREPADRR
jgi:hypothetical protein